MNYPIPDNPQDIAALCQNTVDEELIAAAIAGVIHIARSQGQSLEDLTAEVMNDDALLEQGDRLWLSRIVAMAWKSLP